MKKECTQCHVIQPIENFSWKIKSKNKRNSHCKNCQNIKTRQHYIDNKAGYKKRREEYKGKTYPNIRKIILDAKSKGCVLCDEKWPYALDFHHLEKKDFTIASHRSLSKLKEEIDKCIVICSNHHRKYHSGHEETIASVSALASNQLKR